jgi:hypothetical protein
MIFVLLMVVAFAGAAQTDIVFTGIAEHHGEKHRVWLATFLKMGKRREMEVVSNFVRSNNCPVEYRIRFSRRLDYFVCV